MEEANSKGHDGTFVSSTFAAARAAPGSCTSLEDFKWPVVYHKRGAARVLLHIPQS